jgi:hypothetical protein
MSLGKLMSLWTAFLLFCLNRQAKQTTVTTHIHKIKDNTKRDLPPHQHLLVLVKKAEQTQVCNTRAIDSWSLHGCVGFSIPVSG